jgi:hypothetical protein
MKIKDNKSNNLTLQGVKSSSRDSGWAAQPLVRTRDSGWAAQPLISACLALAFLFPLFGSKGTGRVLHLSAELLLGG